MSGDNRNNDNGNVGCILFGMFLIFAIPFVGAYLVAKGETLWDKILGLVLAIGGVLLLALMSDG